MFSRESWSPWDLTPQQAVLAKYLSFEDGREYEYTATKAWFESSDCDKERVYWDIGVTAFEDYWHYYALREWNHDKVKEQLVRLKELADAHTLQMSQDKPPEPPEANQDLHRPPLTHTRRWRGPHPGTPSSNEDATSPPPSPTEPGDSEEPGEQDRCHYENSTSAGGSARR